MYITIYSRLADLTMNLPSNVDLQSPTWSGKIDIPLSENSLLEDIFRYFNVVTQADAERLDEIGYRLPSLSVGDTVMFDGRIFYCASQGWQEITKTVGGFMVV